MAPRHLRSAIVYIWVNFYVALRQNVRPMGLERGIFQRLCKAPARYVNSEQSLPNVLYLDPNGYNRLKEIANWSRYSSVYR